MTKNKERGSEAAMRKREITLRRWEQMPGPSSQAENSMMIMRVITKIVMMMMMMMMKMMPGPSSQAGKKKKR